jgi:bacterioferritin
MNDKQALIDLLNADLRDEHAALIQYLQHAYAIGEGEEACEIEAIARQEMYHFDWLAETVVELGGRPDMTRGAVDVSGEGAKDWMARDVAAEERAIAQYKAHIAAIDHPKIKRLLQRILSDEESHRGDFDHLRAKFAAREDLPATPLAARVAEGASPQVLDILQSGVQHEYTVILQYLYHRFLMPDAEVGNELETQAINEMQHLGWLSEEVAGLGGQPHIEHTAMALEGTPQEMLQADIDAERAVTHDYNRQIPMVQDEGLKRLLARIRDHEIYHGQVFSDLLAELKAKAEADAEPEAPPSPLGKLTVGSLLKSDE